MFAFRAGGELAQYINMHDNKSQFVVNCIETVRRQEASGDDAATLRGVGSVIPATRLSSVHLPLFDVRVVAGFPIPLDSDEAAQRIDLLKMLCPNPEASYLIRVEGNSMIDAGIYSGDIIIVDKSNRDPSPSEVAVCELNGDYTLKHFVKRGDEGWLVPANPDYPELKVTEDDDFSVWGTVTYIIHKPRG